MCFSVDAGCLEQLLYCLSLLVCIQSSTVSGNATIRTCCWIEEEPSPILCPYGVGWPQPSQFGRGPSENRPPHPTPPSHHQLLAAGAVGYTDGYNKALCSCPSWKPSSCIHLDSRMASSHLAWPGLHLLTSLPPSNQHTCWAH